MNIETANVERHQDKFFVSSTEDLYSIKVCANRVEQITKKVPDVDETEVAILLATINEKRVESKLRKYSYKEIDKVAADSAIIRLLQNYDIGNLNDIFEELKYYELRDLLEADNFMEVLEAML